MSSLTMMQTQKRHGDFAENFERVIILSDGFDLDQMFSILVIKFCFNLH